jgi:hypothetical protein
MPNVFCKINTLEKKKLYCGMNLILVLEANSFSNLHRSLYSKYMFGWQKYLVARINKDIPNCGIEGMVWCSTSHAN